MHGVLVNRLGGLSLPRKSVVRLTDRPDMTLDVHRGRKTTMQQQQQKIKQVLRELLVLRHDVKQLPLGISTLFCPLLDLPLEAIGTEQGTTVY